MDVNDKLSRLREWCLSHKPSASGYDDLPARLADAKRYAMEAVIEQVDRLLAEPEPAPETYPDDLGTPCTAQKLSQRCHELRDRILRQSAAAPAAAGELLVALESAHGLLLRYKTLDALKLIEESIAKARETSR